tara:strand:- start:622 stop:762 length:141 start_codon:yes stop_codon:yes gene_type:complete
MLAPEKLAQRTKRQITNDIELNRGILLFCSKTAAAGGLWAQKLGGF